MATEGVTGARRLMRSAWWYVSGSGSTPGPRVVKAVVGDPMNNVTAHALRAMFVNRKIDATLKAATQGPMITRYEVVKGAEESVDKILKLGNEIAYAVGSDSVRIVNPIPGKSAIGIEVPRPDPQPVLLADLLKLILPSAHPLCLPFGRDVEGANVLFNLADAPHLLVGGATGAGKSAFINSLITSIITRATPDQVKLLLIDPKRVELVSYAGIPHLVMPIVTDAETAIAALEWLITEMERRYDLLAAAKVKNIDAYNKANPTAPLCFLVAIVDELAELVMAGEKELEDAVVRIAQLARAAGIHLVLATQRPSVNVVTGLIKANMPSRLAFTAASGIDSKTILDRPGAEDLLGQGDALFIPNGQLHPTRLRGAFVSDAEIDAAVAKAKQWNGATLFVELETKLVSAETDPMLDQAHAIVRDAGEGSASGLQKALKIGFTRANKILDELHALGVVGPAVKGKSRVLLPKPEGDTP